MSVDFSNLQRCRNPMPEWIEQALRERGVIEDYRKRPAYQQNDYLGWIEQAIKKETKLRRLNQMLDELEAGGVYMNMEHPASRKR